MADRYIDLLATIEIVDSIVGRGASEVLAGNYTIGAVLHVVNADAAVPPYSAISVETILAGRSGSAAVEISHTSASGLREHVVRPVDAAVPLFWRFVTAKFGIVGAP